MSAPAETRPGRDRVSEAAADPLQGAGRWGFPLGRWRRRQPTGWRIADAVLAIGLLAGVVIVTNLDHMPQGLAGFLAIRLSVKNALLITAFGWAWPWVLALCGLYSPSRLRTGKGELVRLLVAGAIGGVVALVFPLTSRSGMVTPLARPAVRRGRRAGRRPAPGLGPVRGAKPPPRAAAPGRAGRQRPAGGAAVPAGPVGSAPEHHRRRLRGHGTARRPGGNRYGAPGRGRGPRTGADASGGGRRRDRAPGQVLLRRDPAGPRGVRPGRGAGQLLGRSVRRRLRPSESGRVGLPRSCRCRQRRAPSCWPSSGRWTWPVRWCCWWSWLR